MINKYEGLFKIGLNVHTIKGEAKNKAQFIRDIKSKHPEIKVISVTKIN